MIDVSYTTKYFLAEKMNKKNRIHKAFFFSALAAIVFLTGCTVPIRTDLVTSEGQEHIYRDGRATLISKKQFIVLVSPTKITREGKERLRLIVSVANPSSVAFDLDTSNFSATVDGRPLKIFTYEEITQEIKTQQAWAALAVALGGAMQAASAQQQASYTTTSGTYNSNTTGNFNAYGTRSNTYGSYATTTAGTYSGWTYNPAAGQATANAVNEKTNANMALLEAQGKSAINEAAQTMLKKTTVLPQSSYGGQIVLGEFDLPRSGTTLELTAKIQGEIHTFLFTQQHQRK